MERVNTGGSIRFEYPKGWRPSREENELDKLFDYFNGVLNKK